MTSNGTFLMRTACPMASMPAPKSLSATVCPSSATFVARVQVGARERRAQGDRPVAELEVVGVVPLMRRRPVLLFARDLRVRAQRRRRGVAHRGDLVLIASRSSHVSVGIEPKPPTRAAARRRAREDDEEVRAHRRELLLDARLRAFTDRHHRDHGRDADDDAERRQERAHLVAHHRAERDAEDHPRFTGAPPSLGSRRRRLLLVGEHEPVLQHDDHALVLRDVVLVRDEHDRDARRSSSCSSAITSTLVFVSRGAGRLVGEEETSGASRARARSRRAAAVRRRAASGGDRGARRAPLVQRLARAAGARAWRRRRRRAAARRSRRPTCARAG
jgi:hypothetical protein